MLRQIEWGAENWPIRKKGDFPVTNLFFWKFYFGLRTSCKALISCTN